jgi:hypothetical protein
MIREPAIPALVAGLGTTGRARTTYQRVTVLSAPRDAEGGRSTATDLTLIRRRHRDSDTDNQPEFSRGRRQPSAHDPHRHTRDESIGIFLP